MDWYSTVFNLIDMRSFSNLWFWIALAVMWSTTSHWVLGVPYDLVQRAGRHGGEAEADLEELVRINTRRLLYISGVSGLWLVSIGSAGLTSLAILGFFYGIEFAQAVFLLAMPMTLVALLSLNTARIQSQSQLTGAPLRRLLHRQRLYTQIIGMISVFITSIWGMYQNMAVGPLGG